VKNNALSVDENDNVVVALIDIAAGEHVLAGGEMVCDASENIRQGHKIARVPIAKDDKVFRYGEPIVQAIRAIAVGESVHVHNTEPIPGDLAE
jgi:altronate hydrolase